MSTSRLAHLFAVLLAASSIAELAAQPARNTPVRLKPLSNESLALLTAGVALYPDEVLDLLTQAARTPMALQRAARLPAGPLAARRPQPQAVARLQREHPELLQLLAEQPALTAQLGIAAQQQSQQFQAAIEQHRHNWNASSQPTVSDYSAEQTQKSLADPATATELFTQVQTLESALASADGEELSAALTGEGQAIDKSVEGPLGGKATVQGQGQGSMIATPKATAAAGSVSGTVAATTPAGKSASATGAGQASAVKTGNETKVQASGSGSATGPNGETKSASGSMSGTVTTNPDGTKSYTGEGTITTDKGTAQTSTTAGNGQASTTVTTEQGSKTFTAGDGTITHQPTAHATKTPTKSGSSAANKSTNSSDSGKPPSARPQPPAGKQPPSTNAPGSKPTLTPAQPKAPAKANYKQMNPQQLQQAQRAHQQSWNMTQQKMKSSPQKAGGKGKGRP